MKPPENQTQWFMDRLRAGVNDLAQLRTECEQFAENGTQALAWLLLQANELRKQGLVRFSGEDGRYPQYVYVTEAGLRHQ